MEWTSEYPYKAGLYLFAQPYGYDGETDTTLYGEPHMHYQLEDGALPRSFLVVQGMIFLGPLPMPGA